MRGEVNNTLDLNNLPDDLSGDIFQFFEEGTSSSSSSGGLIREKQDKDGKEYECRFCSLKFFKSQALGGHMNRHRQERETESLNKARELVLRNDSFPPPPPHQAPPSLSYHQGDHVHIGDLITPHQPIPYPPRLYSISASSSALPQSLPPLVQTYLYDQLPSTQQISPFPHRHTNDNYMHNNGTRRKQTLTNNGHIGYSSHAPPESSYTFIGATVTNDSRVAPPFPQPYLPPHHGL